MTHNFTIIPEKNLLKEEFSGDLTLECLTEANKNICNHPDFKKGLKFLTDLTQAIIPIHYKEMLQHVEGLPCLGIAKQAFIVSSKSQYGMVRMYLTLIEDYQDSKCEIFTSLKEAEIWLI